MEESLKRLRSVRDKSSNANKNQETDSKPGSVSDDDKIRLQLLVDVQNYGQAMEKWNVEKNPDFVQLETLVGEATAQILPS